MSRATGQVTTTSYAVLGLLAIRPWSTYELTRQMDRSLGRIWPRATSKLYEEPRKLVALGLARSREEWIGERARTVYRITPKGRRALAAWLREPPAGPVLEAEPLLRMIFADNGTRTDALAALAATRAWAEERNEANVAVGRSYAAGRGLFQERAAQNMLVGSFLTDFYRLVAEWAEWASGNVERWPDDPGQATPDPAEMAAIVRRAEW
jgi:PadR family transcriptional regulator, regulatory protein AphA